MLCQFNFTDVKHCPCSLEQFIIGVFYYVTHFKGYHLNYVDSKKEFETYSPIKFPKGPYRENGWYPVSLQLPAGCC